jgi:hypothetical protein
MCAAISCSVFCFALSCSDQWQRHTVCWSLGKLMFYITWHLCVFRGYLPELSSSGHTLPDIEQFAALSCTLCTLCYFQNWSWMIQLLEFSSWQCHYMKLLSLLPVIRVDTLCINVCCRYDITVTCSFRGDSCLMDSQNSAYVVAASTVILSGLILTSRYWRILTSFFCRAAYCFTDVLQLVSFCLMQLNFIIWWSLKNNKIICLKQNKTDL